MTPTAEPAHGAPGGPVGRYGYGKKSRPWVHVAAAFLAGTALTAMLVWMAIPVLLSGLPGLMLGLVLILIAAAVFGGIGRFFLGRQTGWWLALTVLVWAPAGLASYFLIMLGADGRTQGLHSIVPALVGGVACGLAAMFSYGRFFRLLAIVGIMTGLILVAQGTWAR